MTFTGYDGEHLPRSNRPDWNSLLAVTDLLLAGPYLEQQRDLSRPWVGSRNQQFFFPTKRYRHLQKSLRTIPNQLQVSVLNDGAIQINGMATTKDLAEFCSELHDLGIQLTPKGAIA